LKLLQLASLGVNFAPRRRHFVFERSPILPQLAFEQSTLLIYLPGNLLFGCFQFTQLALAFGRQFPFDTSNRFLVRRAFPIQSRPFRGLFPLPVIPLLLELYAFRIEVSRQLMPQSTSFRFEIATHLPQGFLMLFPQLLRASCQFLTFGLTQRFRVPQRGAFNLKLLFELLTQRRPLVFEFQPFLVELIFALLNSDQQFLALRDTFNQFVFNSLQLITPFGEFFFGLLLLQSKTALILVEHGQLFGQVRFPPFQFAHTVL
jgi:hypothetical protein